ncbi:MAG: efflux RND transporter permease subunit [Gemmatimonadetes bacterium]|nr:efflux RND transporter permease subunit [Gemmatimonadota bacterium]
MKRTPENGAPRVRRNLSSLAIRRPIGTLMLTSVIFVLGFFYLSRLSVDLLPSIVYPNIRVNVNYAGVDPEVLEEVVAKPLERALATTENLDRMETEIQEGRVGINLGFSYGTDIDFALQDVTRNLERVRARMPDDADPPVAFKMDPSQIPIYEVAFSSGTRDLVSLREWVDNRLAPQILTSGGVASVDVAGGLVREVQVVLDQERLRSYGLTASQIIDALRVANVDVAAGRVTSTTREVVGKTTGKFRDVQEMRSLLINLPGGGRIPLGEVASVTDTNQEQRLWTRLNGVPAVRMSVRKQPGSNTVAVAEGVDDRLRTLADTRFIPADIEYRTTQNQANFIRNSVAAVRNAAVLGAILSMLVVLVFLRSVRKTFVIGIAIPVAVLATFMLMGMGNLTLNIMSLGGLALGVGMLVDNSIVMLENIFRRMKESHLDPQAGAHEGAAEVQTAVIAGTTTNISAVVPFLLITGLVALIFKELILTISFAILASLLVALTVVPMLSAQLAKVGFSSGIDRWGPLVAFGRGVERTQDRYRRMADRMLRWRGLILVGAVAALMVAWPLVGTLGNEFLPQVDDGGVGIGVNMPPGTSADRTNAVVLEVEKMVRTMPHVQTVFATAGGNLFGSATAANAGRGSLDVNLVSASQRDMSADEWVGMMQQKINERGFPGARIFVRPPRIRGLRTNNAGSGVALTIQGDNLAELKAISDEVIERIRDVPGLQGAQSSIDEASPQISVRVDPERASYLGLNVSQVGQTLRTAMDGTIATRFTEGNREYDVRVMFPRERFTSPEDLGTVALFPGQSGGSPIYLRDVAAVSSGVGPTSIQRENQNRILRVTGDVLAEVATVGEVTTQVQRRLADLRLPEGYAILYGGEAEAIAENNRQLLIVGLLAVFLVFVVLAVQYDSLLNPLVILLAIPLSLLGVILALWVTSTPLGATVLLGVVLLSGIVVNNSILLVEFAEGLRAKGASRRDAMIEAGAERMRPIFMTTLTTMFGMFPLALGIGEGTEMMQPLAVAVIGGLSLSTVLTLLVVPSAYLVFHAAGDRAKGWIVGRRDARDEVPSLGRDEIPVAGD